MAVSNSGFSGAISRPSAVLEGDLSKESSQLGGDIPKYGGPYTVTPSVEAQTLETAGKLMESDTTVKAIPVYEVSNAAGGTTVYIANEV